ncbi:MAG: hypothetical protein JWQ57_2633 [Mucilaginibacter sp.]|jgi:hypothetical protein|nr:hypothetical protein [Mucilaginibacter sp.]
MTSFAGSPFLIKGGIVLVDPLTSAILRVITLQYNPDTLTRTMQVHGTGGEGNNRSEALRLTGPPTETIKLEAEIDGTDDLETADKLTGKVGIQPQLAALETIIYPPSYRLIANNIISMLGTIEILPVESALTLFIWNASRIMPVRITEFSITEEAFDVNLNPIRAKVSLGMRVLNTDDLGFMSKGGFLYMGYQLNKEVLAAMFTAGSLSKLGIKAVV